MDKIKNGAEEIYLAPETETSEELVIDEPIEEIENEDIPVMVEAEPKKNVRVGEILDLRENNRKVFRMSDGTEQAVFYPTPVHVYDDETHSFKEVENTLVEEEDGRHFVCGKNNFVAKFSREEENDELFFIESGMHRVTVFAKKNIKHKNKGVKPQIQKKSRDNAGNLVAIRFSDVEAGTDYEYCLHGNGVKEDIIIKEKASVYRYPFIMKCENVTPKLDEKNKRIAFHSDETGDEIFFIPAPFMTDANGITSGNVDYVMRNAANGDVHFSINADSEWINSERRAFPVVIDPQIMLSGSTDMTSYSWDNGYMGSEIYHKVGIVGCTAEGYSVSTSCDTGTSSSLSNATLLTLNSWMSGTISCSGDQDWYKFVTSGAGCYTISTQGSMDSMGYLYDANGCLITYNDDCNGSRNFSITATLSANTTYYLMVKAYGSNTGTYSVGVVFEGSTDADQGGSTPEVKGTLLTLDNWVNDSIECSNDEKWYTFRATAGNGTYIITTKGTMDTMGYLYDSNNNRIAYNDDSNGLNFKISACLSGGSTYYVKVRAFSTKTGNYTVGVTTESCATPEQPVICYSPQRMYMSFTMPVLPRNPRIKKAMLKFYQRSGMADCGSQVKIGLYQVTGSINTGLCTPSYNSELIDFAEAKAESYTNGVMTSYSFDITTLVDKLSKGETSAPRFMLKAMDESISCQSYVELFGASSGYSPEIVVDYESSYGVNTSYRTHTHELGHFGQGSIDLQCGNLMFESEDFAWSGNRMPVTLKHLYNSALANYRYTANSSIKLNTADFSAMKLGYGFKLNLMQSMASVSFQHEGTAYDGYVFIGENGEETYFKASGEQKCDSNGQCYYLYKDVDSDEAIYNPETRTLIQGDEVRTFDTSGRLVSVKDKYNEMQIIYNDAGRITTVIDGAGREFAFQYSNGFLSSITAPDETQIIYTYNGNLLNTVTYPDGRKAVITYTSNKPQTVSILDASGKTAYKVEYAYSGDKVYSVKEYGENGAEGVKTVYSYSAASGRTVVQTYELKEEAECEDCYETAIKTVYTFDDNGNIVSEYVYSEDTGNVAAKGEESGINPHSGDGGAGVVSNINNLLLNHNFNGLNNWYEMGCNCGDFYISNYAYEPYTKFGKKLLRMQSYTADCGENGVYQVTNTLPKGQYTFSAYMRVLSSFSGENSGAYIRVTKTNGEVLAESEHIAKADSEFIRLIAPFELTSAQSVQVQIIVNGRGTVYADAAQLENNAFANAYNMLINGNFELSSGWNTSGAYYTTGTRFNMQRAMYMTGGLDYTRKAWQRIYVKSNRTTRETFTLSGWAKGYGLPAHERDGSIIPTFRLRAVIKYNDSYYGEYGTEEYKADFLPCTEEWQLASVQFAKSKYRTVDYIDVYLEYDHNFGTAYFDDIQLVRNSIETELSAEDFKTEPENETTDNTVAEAESENTDDTEFKEKVDAYGNTLTETTFTDGEFGTIYRAFGFTPDCNCAENAGNDLIIETDARGNKTNYTVDEDTSRNEEVTDRCGNKTAYEYDVSGRTTKVTSKKADGTEIANVSYAYDSFDNMTEILRGDGMKYALAYNAYHNLESIGVDGKDEKLVQYTYKNGNGRLKEMSYANGDRMTATYNGIGQMTAEKWYNSLNELIAHYKYVYDGQGNIVRSIDILDKKEYNYLYEDGKIVQATESDIVLNENDFVTSKAFVCAVRYYYGAEDKLTKKHIKLADGKEHTVLYENTENDSQVVRFTANGRTVTSHSKTDSFGRKVFDELQLGAGFLSRQFGYVEGEFTEEHINNDMLKSTPTTSLVSQIVLSNGLTLTYGYDEEERITSVTETRTVDGVPTASTTLYTYDALGQLLTETVNGEVVNTMTYDNYGNILSKNGVAYTYGDGDWKDLLTSHNGRSITYDKQGNPTSYLGHTLIWEKGRQLKTFDGNTYTYNANGIRKSKTVYGIRHDFVLDGAKILRETWDNNTLIPLYDNEDNVCGIEYNGTAYYFLKNLQGDVIAITDNSGKAVAKYSYDAWGVCTVTQDTSDRTIATVNPYRYRSYYYDDEIGMYYLQSRYYDPSVGRFVNADEAEIICESEFDVHCNLFEYGNNSIINLIDPDGYDAVFVLDHTDYGLPIAGHAVLCFEDRNGKWWYTEYNVTQNGSLVIKKRSAKVSLFSLNSSAQKRFFNRVTYVGARNGTVPIYIRGNFTACYSLARNLNGSRLGGYHLLYNNCLHYILRLLAVSKCTNNILNIYFRRKQTVPMLFAAGILSLSYDYRNIQIVRTNNFTQWIKIKKRG